MFPMPPIPPIVIKLLGGLLAVLALFLLVQNRNHWKAKATDRQAIITATCNATRAASGNPKLECARVDAQIAETGKALKAVTDALNDQNAAVGKLKAERDAAQASAAKLADRNRPRLDRIDGTIGRLDASARETDRQTKPCEPSTTLKGAWR